MASSYRERIALFQHVLTNTTHSKGSHALIDFERLRRLCFRGVPDTSSLRQLCWKLLLNYLPSDTSTWSTILTTKRNSYRDFVLDLCTITDPANCTKVANSPNELVVVQQSINNPLSNSPDVPPNPTISSPVSHIDLDLIDTIDKDVRRTLPSMSFFHDKVVDLPNTKLPPRRAFFNLNEYNECFDKNYLAVERILYTFAKLNPGIGYIQGMNHVAFVIFYLMATDDQLEHKANAEADAFFLFHEVMTDYKDYFIGSMDADATGINNAMRKLGSRISHLDPELFADLTSKGVEPTYYAFRWFTCLCAQEFHIPDLLRLWDSVFADRLQARHRGGLESEQLRRQLNQPTNQQQQQQNQLSAMDASLMMDAGVWSSTLVDVTDESVHLSRQGQFLPDFMATLILVHRDSLLELAFDECIQLLQQQPTKELDTLLQDTYQLILIGQTEEDQRTCLKPNEPLDLIDSTALAMNVWMNAAMKRAGISGTHQRSRSLGQSINGWLSPSRSPTEQPPEKQQEVEQSPKPVRHHRQTASLSGLGGLWTKLKKEIGSSSP